MDRRLRAFKKALVNSRLGQELVLLKETGSTNDGVKERAEQGAPEGFTVVADRQTSGRGRRGRSWLSLPGKGVYLSVLLRPHWPATDAVFLSICSAVAVARVLEQWRLKAVRLKWPNDVLVQGRKIAGVLVEPRIKKQVIEFAVVGVGVNVLHREPELAPLGPGRATSLHMEGVHAECDLVAVQVINALDICYFMAQQEDKGRILKEWLARQSDKPGV
jgi:BirA family biotin operon repressor/biotin-[acetyl-CoA-carboxylase] ligase